MSLDAEASPTASLLNASVSESIAVPLLHQYFPGVRAPPRAKLREFLSENNVPVKEGKFSPQEDKRIVKNFKRFVKKCDLADCKLTRCALLGFGLELEDEDEEMFHEIKSLVKEGKFHLRLAHRLPDRLISAVYCRAKKLLIPFQKQKEIDKEKIAEIIEYAKSLEDYTKTGNKYHHIAQVFDVCPLAVRRIINRTFEVETKEDFNRGRWTPEETCLLMESICKVLKIESDELTPECITSQSLPWNLISDLVQTRSESACREHAMRCLTRALVITHHELIPSNKKKKSTDKLNKSQTEKDYNKGEWKSEETCLLMESICQVLEKQPDELTPECIKSQSLPWNQISDHVQTRTENDCKKYATGPLTRALKIALTPKKRKKSTNSFTPN